MALAQGIEQLCAGGFCKRLCYAAPASGFLQACVLLSPSQEANRIVVLTWPCCSCCRGVLQEAESASSGRHLRSQVVTEHDITRVISKVCSTAFAQACCCLQSV
eukprot:GHRQ01032276.1.p1 GENE.GHRQ01032276.1~~GHRQ01032276.1.p1  ORF type:complete len:104 (-),score=5.02 GHRQ01032276.1:263-574(-)